MTSRGGELVLDETGQQREPSRSRGGGGAGGDAPAVQLRRAGTLSVGEERKGREASRTQAESKADSKTVSGLEELEEEPRMFHHISSSVSYTADEPIENFSIRVRFCPSSSAHRRAFRFCSCHNRSTINWIGNL